MDITIFAKSSSQTETTYSVNFIIDDGKLHVYCSCPAGYLSGISLFCPFPTIRTVSN
jgi:hypothetical protein